MTGKLIFLALNTKFLKTKQIGMPTISQSSSLKVICPKLNEYSATLLIHSILRKS